MHLLRAFSHRILSIGILLLFLSNVAPDLTHVMLLFLKPTPASRDSQSVQARSNKNNKLARAWQ